jgi:hypothetical protein
MDDQVARLTGAGLAIEELRIPIEAGAPWPLAERFDHAPEAAWGPPEVLAHVHEMLGFWLGEIERVLDGSPEPVPFGRVAVDEVRLGIIERDRSLPLRELFARIEIGVWRLEQRLAELGSADAVKRGLHQTLGELPIDAIAERFVVSHFEEHVRQLEEILAGADAEADAGGTSDPAAPS